MASRKRALSLYKLLLRESQKFSGYNYRMYAQRRVRDAFHENKTVTDETKNKELLGFAEENLEVIKRQVVISQLYKEPKLVIEQQAKDQNS